MEKTVILIKPDAVKKGVIGKIITRFEEEGFKLTAAKFLKLPDDVVDLWYAHHKEKSFFSELKTFMTSTPVMAMLWEGEKVIVKVREICGSTDSRKATKGTIRGTYGLNIHYNAIHASEDYDNAKRETDLIFLPHEIYEY